MNRLYQHPVGEEDEPDGRNNWWADYSESQMSSATENGRIDLNDNLQYKWFNTAMNTLRENKSRLSGYDKRLFEDLDAAAHMAGRDLTITRKQMNHIKTVAADLEQGR